MDPLLLNDNEYDELDPNAEVFEFEYNGSFELSDTDSPENEEPFQFVDTNFCCRQSTPNFPANNAPDNSSNFTFRAAKRLHDEDDVAGSCSSSGGGSAKKIKLESTNHVTPAKWIICENIMVC